MLSTLFIVFKIGYRDVFFFFFSMYIVRTW